MPSPQEASTVRTSPTGETSSDNTGFIEDYKQLLATRMSNEARAVLEEKDHKLFQELAKLFAKASKEQLQYLLDCVHEERVKYSIPSGCSRREKPKSAERLLEKLAFADWIACRLEAEFVEFPRLEKEFQDHLGEEVVLVWRNDYRKEPDVVQYGYAYVPGSLAILEIQIIEPFAAWVFRNNSINKHLGDSSYVTFQESKKVYSVLKEAILKGEKPVDPIVNDVVTYYEGVRRANLGDPAMLNKAELERLQAIITKRFESPQGKS